MVRALRTGMRVHRCGLRPRRAAGLVLAGLSLAIIAQARAAPPPASKVRLRHQLSPGSVVTYAVHIETTRAPDEGARTQVQTGTLVRVMFREDQPGQATCAQMLELKHETPASGPAESQLSDSRPATTLPAIGAPVPQTSVLFSTARVEIERAPFIIPGRTAWARQVLSALLQVTNWPKDKVSAGDGWDRAIRAGPRAGKQLYRVADVQKVNADLQVRLTVKTELDPPADPANRHLVSAESTLLWSARDHELLSLQGHATWREAASAGGGDSTTRVTLERSRRSHLTESQQSAERQAVMHVAEAIAAYRRQDEKYATRSVQIFLARWPSSRWRPVAEFIQRQIDSAQASRASLTSDELKHALTQFLAAWNQAEQEEDFDLQDQHRSSLGHVNEVNRPEITRLLEDADPSFRALACFALAFGSVPADVALIQEACGDADVRVRRTALYALAIRASALTDPQVLLPRLEDEDAAVRQRACQATGACVGKDSPRLSDARSALAARLGDPSPDVVLAAARAIMSVGSPEDIEKVRQAAKSDAVPPETREAIESVLDRDSAAIR